MTEQEELQMLRALVEKQKQELEDKERIIGKCLKTRRSAIPLSN